MSSDEYDLGYLRGYRHGVMDLADIVRSTLARHENLQAARKDVRDRLYKLNKVLKEIPDER